MFVISTIALIRARFRVVERFILYTTKKEFYSAKNFLLRQGLREFGSLRYIQRSLDIFTSLRLPKLFFGHKAYFAFFIKRY